MFENIKKKIARYIIRRKYIGDKNKSISFNKIVSDSKHFLIVMPGTNNEFNHCREILRYFEIHKKSITLFIAEHLVNSVKTAAGVKFFPYQPANITRFFLPDKVLVHQLSGLKFDVVIDLSRTENVFLSAVSNIVASECRIGFSKDNSQEYYNLQVVNNNEIPEISYRNFLNFLKMF